MHAPEKNDPGFFSVYETVLVSNLINIYFGKVLR